MQTHPVGFVTALALAAPIEHAALQCYQNYCQQKDLQEGMTRSVKRCRHQPKVCFTCGRQGVHLLCSAEILLLLGRKAQSLQVHTEPGWFYQAVTVLDSCSWGTRVQCLLSQHNVTSMDTAVPVKLNKTKVTRKNERKDVLSIQLHQFNSFLLTPFLTNSRQKKTVVRAFL